MRAVGASPFWTRLSENRSSMLCRAVRSFGPPAIFETSALILPSPSWSLSASLSNLDGPPSCILQHLLSYPRHEFGTITRASEMNTEDHRGTEYCSDPCRQKDAR